MNADDPVYVSYRYLDASAAVKLVARELASDVVREYFEAGGPFYITYPCVVEVLSVLKAKHFYRGELTQEQYSHATYGFLAHLRGRLNIRGPALENGAVFWDAEELARRHNLDIIDALQLFTVKFSGGVGPSSPLLITADKNLAKAARAEQLNTWDCVHEKPPA